MRMSSNILCIRYLSLKCLCSSSATAINHASIQSLITAETGGQYDGILRSIQQLAVRRKDLLHDTILQMQNRKFDCNLKLNIHFIGEEAEDGGSPRREFFRLILKALADSGHFYGLEEYCTPLRNAIARQQGHFRMAGSLMSLVQGGPAPAFVNHAVVQYLCSRQEDIVATIAQVPDFEVQEKLKMLHFHVSKDYSPNAHS